LVGVVGLIQKQFLLIDRGNYMSLKMMTSRFSEKTIYFSFTQVLLPFRRLYSERFDL